MAADLGVLTMRKWTTFNSQFLGGGASLSGLLGGIGSWYNLCHFLCMSVVSLLAIFGITLNILPLMFLQTYQFYFWMAALFFTNLSLVFYLNQKTKRVFERNLLLINYGLIIFGIPFSQVADYMDFFRFLGISLIVAGLFLLLFSKKFQSVFIDQENISYEYESPVGKIAKDSLEMPKFNVSRLLFTLVIGGFLVNQYLMYRMDVFADLLPKVEINNNNGLMAPQSKMKLTAFDISLAKERMDKNGDGICDTCGMPIQQCIDSGQIDCNMSNNPQAIGVLGTSHDHADLNIYVDGKRLVLAKPENYMKSSFMHLDNNQNPDDANSVLHMHAKKVPLWLFFRSLGMNITKDSLTLSDGRVLKNENGKMLKFYLNGKKVDELSDYTFQPLDKLLISYGSENNLDIDNQINSMTNFAKDH